MVVRLHVWGDFACFTRPEMKVERYSYEVMTPSAARGILEAIYWHPGVRWNIRRISVCKPIRMMSIERNEVTEKFSVRNLKTFSRHGGRLPALHPSKAIAQRSSTILRDVDYVIEAGFSLDPRDETNNDSLTSGKVISIFDRRARKGQYFHHPYFGTREFPVDFELLEPGGEKGPDPIPETKDLGFMLYDLDFRDKEHPSPLFFHARLQNGVMTVPPITSLEVHR